VKDGRALAAAMDKTSTLDSLTARISMAIGVAGTDAPLLDMSADAAIDFTHRREHAVMHGTQSMFKGNDSSPDTSSETVQDGDVEYTKDADSREADPARPWRRTNRAWPANESGGMFQLGADGPQADMAALAAAAGHVDDVGHETIHGVDATHYS